MGSPRRHAAAVKMSPTKWWITGGYYGSSGSSFTEVYEEGRGFTGFVELPGQQYLHNMVKVNETHYVLLGGGQGYS